MDDTVASWSLTADSSGASRVAKRSARLAPVAFFLGAAAQFALTTLMAIVNFGWRQPMFDQYRSYRFLLELPFPQNLLQLDNGHRPIVPNVFRLAEINWFDANQLLQLSIGTLCALMSAALIARCVWRESALPLIARATGVMLGVLGILWLANARMLLHGNESLHAYSIVLTIVIAALCMHRAARTRQVRWLLFACTGCVVATFCFGPGIATFAAVIALILLLRLPLHWVLAPAAAMAACLAVYVYVLPGNEGVRGMVGLHPVDSARIAAQWIASPWVNGWLGMADPPLEASIREGVNRSAVGPALSASANAIEHVLHLSWEGCALLLGLAGTATFALRVARLWLRREAASRLQVLSIALGLFALASAAIIGIGRLRGLTELPSQIFADRYLMWPSLFWAALALLLLPDICRANSRLLRGAALTFAALLPIALWPTQRAWADWGAAVYRSAQRSAASARSGAFDPAVFPDGPDAPRRDVEVSLAHFRERHLAMFAQNGWERLGTRLHVASSPSVPLDASAGVRSTFRDSNEATIARVEGVVTQGLGNLHGRALALIDGSDTVVGFAEPSFVVDGRSALRLSRAVKRGFDGYIRDYDAQRKYRLVIISEQERDVAQLLCSVEGSHPQ